MPPESSTPPEPLFTDASTLFTAARTVRQARKLLAALSLESSVLSDRINAAERAVEEAEAEFDHLFGRVPA